MKKKLFLSFIVALLLSGCASSNDNTKTYDPYKDREEVNNHYTGDGEDFHLKGWYPVDHGLIEVEEGEEIELTANVQDITDGNMVTLQVFPEGKGPEDSVALAKFPLFVKGGSVSAKWLYRADQRELPPDSDPKFVFTAHSAWCNFEKSSNSLEVKLIRPEITKAEWQDEEGSSTSKGLVGRPLKLVAETKDMEGGVTFWIYDDKGRQVASLGAEIEGDKAEAEWTYHWDGTPLKEKPKFKFKVTGNRCKKVESGDVEISEKFIIELESLFTEDADQYKYYLIMQNDKEEEIKIDDGEITKEDLIPSKYKVIARKQ